MAFSHSSEDVDERSDFGDLRPGLRLGRYELLAPIARGGMARVWAARLDGHRFQKIVALKTILPDLARQNEFERMFLDEAAIAACVHHPNVCETYELGEAHGTLYLAMEWVNGDTVSRVLRGRGYHEAMEPRVAARLVADVCAGLHAAHELVDEEGWSRNVVHRDLSPQNVLLTADGIAKICDFGVAKAIGQLQDGTRSGQMKGKLAYMAPEQATGGFVDRRSDIFSVGVVLYEATTGQRPFRGEGDAQVMHALLQGRYEPPSAIQTDYPAELEAIIARALAREPSARYPSAEAMRLELEEFLARGPIVTQANIAEVLHERLADRLERRRERLRRATEQPGNSYSLTPSGVIKAAPVRVAPQPPPAPAPAPAPAPDDDEDVPDAPDQTDVMAVAPVAAPLEDAPHEDAPPSTPTPIIDWAAAMPMPGWPLAEPQGPEASRPQTQHPSLSPASGREPAWSPLAPPPAAFETHASQPPLEVPGRPQIARGLGPIAAAAAIGAVAASMLFLVAAPGLLRRRDAESLTVGPAASPPAATLTSASEAEIQTSLELRVSPPDAALTVDGAPLGPGLHTLPRPTRGNAFAVVAHADGYADGLVLVDDLTTSPVVLSLAPLGTPSAAPDGSRAPAD